MFWDEVLDALRLAAPEALRGEFAQFESMYGVLSGCDIPPLTSPADLVAWREPHPIGEQGERRLLVP